VKESFPIVLSWLQALS